MQKHINSKQQFEQNEGYADVGPDRMILNFKEVEGRSGLKRFATVIEDINPELANAIMFRINFIEDSLRALWDPEDPVETTEETP